MQDLSDKRCALLWCERRRDEASRIYARHGHVPLMAWVFATREVDANHVKAGPEGEPVLRRGKRYDRVTIVPCPHGTQDEGPNMFAVALKAMAKGCEAVGVVWCNVVTLTPVEGPQGEVPTEAIVMHAEHKAFGQRMWFAPIGKSATGQDVALGWTEEKQLDAPTGRLTGFIEWQN